MTPSERAHKARRDRTFREMMRDRRVTDAARVLGAEIYLRGKADDGGWLHEIGHRDFATLNSGKADDETIRRRLAQLKTYGYLAQYPNGRRNPLYEFAPSQVQGETSIDPTPEQGERERFPHTGAGGNIDPPPEQGESPALGGGFIGGANSAEEEDGERRERRLDPDADSLLAAKAAVLGPAANALRLYLPRRSPVAQQLGYVATVAGWIEGIGTKLTRNDGTPVAGATLAELVAAAAMELLGSNEAAMTRPVGDPANLWTKTNILANPVASTGYTPKAGTEAARVAASGVETPGKVRTPSGIPTSPSLLQASIEAFNRRTAAQNGAGT